MLFDLTSPRPFGLTNSTWSETDGSSSFFSCVDTAHLTQGYGNGWGCHIVISAGYVCTAAMAIPCGRWNLDDNMSVQVGFGFGVGIVDEAG